MGDDRELKEAWDKAFSMESMPGERSADLIETIEKENWLYDFYKDNTGAYWFKLRIRQTDGEIVTLDEAVFGKRRRRH